MKHGYDLDVKWEFWKATGKIRNELDNSLNDFVKSAVSKERAAEVIAAKVDALWVDRLCDPWFT